MRIWAALTALSLLVTWTATAAQDEAYPKPITGNPQPRYPAAAQAGAIEGDVEYRAAVRSDGTVESVTILHVPRSNMGFEGAVEDAVKRWRFQPATAGNSATGAVYSGTISFRLSIPREWMYAMSSRTAWTLLRDLARELKLGAERLDDHRQVLVTDWQPYRGRSFPESASLGLPIGQLPEKIQFHLQVAPGMEPARVAIGSIIQTKTMADSRREGFTIYGHQTLSDWLLAKLTEGAGKKPESLSLSADRRAEQSRLLMPADLSDTCTTRVAAMAPFASLGQAGATKPRVISQVQPIYPRTEDRRQPKVLFEAEITEQGTLINMHHLKPTDTSEDFKAASQLAATLWRFEPGMLGGCRARTLATFEMSFVNK